MRPWDALEISVTILPVREFPGDLHLCILPRVKYLQNFGWQHFWDIFILHVLLRNNLFKAYKAWEDSEAPGFCSTLSNTSRERGERLFDLSTDAAAVTFTLRKMKRVLPWHPMARWLQLCSSLGRTTCHSFRGGVVLEGVRAAFDWNWIFRLFHIIYGFYMFLCLLVFSTFIYFVIPGDWAREPWKELLEW